MESQSQVSMHKTDDIINGGGFAGYAAARTACDASADVAIVDGLISLCDRGAALCLDAAHGFVKLRCTPLQASSLVRRSSARRQVN
jgi:heptaprenylglyceryl phosphate synthase